MTESSEGSGSGGSSSLLDMLPTDKLTEVAETLLKTMTGKAVDAAIDQIENLTGKLTDVAENGGQGLGSGSGSGSGDGSGDGAGSVTDTLKSGISTLTSGVGDKVKGALGMSTDSDSSNGSGGGSGGSGGGGGSGKFKFMNITESMDVGVPVRVAYDQWTQFADFPSFMKKVETVDQESDEKLNWKAQVFWSHRSWESTISEQIPDTHIIWRSTGAKGYADGTVSFHELAPRLTRILLVLEYYPQGFFEKTGNLWRAVGRRTRLEFKHFGRNLMMDTILTPAEDLEGWRGEIRDSEVVKTHEEALEEEQADADEQDGDDPEDQAEEGQDAEDWADEDADTEDADADADTEDADADADAEDADAEDADAEDADAEDADAEDADAEDADAEPSRKSGKPRQGETRQGETSGRGRRSRRPAPA